MSILEKMRLNGKAALVTGGARGIGLSIVSALAEAGADVAVVDVDKAEAEKAAAQVAKATGRKIAPLQVDVTDPEQVGAMVADVVSQFGKLDIAFCNAGICLNIPAEEMTFAQWKQVLDVNLDGVFLTATAAGKQMIAQGHGGSIVTTASMSAHIVNRPQPQCAYNASKAAVIQLTKSLAIEWAGHGIRVNSISPGYIGTELTLNSPTLQPLIKQWNADAPLHRMGAPEELQSIAVYLAGDTSSFTTGSDFLIDGGFTCV